MKTLQEHKEELIKNLTKDGYKAKEKQIEYDDELYCVKAQRKVFIFFNRTFIYILTKEVDSDKLKELIKLVKKNFLSYHIIWIAADHFTEQVKDFADNNQQIGLINIELKEN